MGGNETARDALPGDEGMKRIIRVFIDKTSCTPDDDMVRINSGPGLFDEADEIHISAVFTWQLPRAEALERQWSRAGFSTKIGGPATGERGGDFVPGMYLKRGRVITSRGCPNRCWFCSVWRREGGSIRELPITEGNNLLDDNILATSDAHFDGVMEMLARGKKQYGEALLTGGLEAARLTQHHVNGLHKLRPERMYFAYDTPNDLEPLVAAGMMLKEAEFRPYQLYAYVLVGYPGDTIEKAQSRLNQTVGAGFCPMAMVYRDPGTEDNRTPDFVKMANLWARPAAIKSKIKEKQP